MFNGAKEEPSVCKLCGFRSQNGNSGSISRPAKIILVWEKQSWFGRTSPALPALIFIRNL